MYGIAIDRLDELMLSVPPEPGKLHTLLTTRAEYALEKLVLRPGDEQEVATSPGEGATVFAETGALQVGSLDARHKRVHVAPGSRVRLRAFEHTTGYIFRGPAGGEIETTAFPATFDQRSKYWGTIETIVNAGYTGKRLFFRKGACIFTAPRWRATTSTPAGCWCVCAPAAARIAGFLSRRAPCCIFRRG